MLGKLALTIVFTAALALATAVRAQAQSAPEGGQARGGEVVVVAPGDNLFRIALRHGMTVDALMRANRLASPDWIVVGQLLRIPSAAELAGETLVAGPGAGIGGAPAYTAPAYTAPTYTMPEGAADAVRYPSGRWIVIDLSDQTLTAYDNGAVAGSFIVSTGKPSTPTVMGNFTIYSRYVSQDMSGPGYYAPGVPFVQYFWSGYSIHGTYWHTDFGTPVSHGCVNMQTPDAQWLWGWSSIGTPVIVQP